MYYVYVIRDGRRGSTYIGYTHDLQKRLKQHRHRMPVLLYYEAYRAEKDARGRERKLKQRGQGIR